MNPAEQSESTIVARLVVAIVAVSSLAAGTALVGSAIESAAPAPAIDANPHSVAT